MKQNLVSENLFRKSVHQLQSVTGDFSKWEFAAHGSWGLNCFLNFQKSLFAKPFSKRICIALPDKLL